MKHIYAAVTYILARPQLKIAIGALAIALLAMYMLHVSGSDISELARPRDQSWPPAWGW